MSKYNNEFRSKLFNYFRQRLDIKKSTKGFYRCNCPYEGCHYAFGINFENSSAHCFKCEVRTSLINLIIYLEGFTEYRQVRDLLGTQQDYETYSERLAVKVDIKPIVLPESYKSIAVGDSFLSESARGYLKRRGFNINRLALKGVGYCTSGEYAGYIVFPIYLKDQLIFFQTRRFIQTDAPKMKNPPSEQFGIGKTQIIYNEDALYIYNKVYLVESITNAETMGDNAIAILGKSISNYQFNRLIKSPAKAIIILLDNDAFINSLMLALSLSQHKKVKLIAMPEGRDVNDLGKKKTKELVSNTPYEDYNQLYKRKINESSTINTH